ncbi:hypothetical protein SAMN05720473_109106 [Fibrobacter sp. UWB15]|jgi:hypothetical protein|uniref:hypothetical protein n=1 Tax=unclassified Fibrobacter TaxID=2634177 RepID=UPI000918C907|nr:MULTISPECIES: hypothetical protein [unclassified Fibrobacter]PWJ63177.1 hypothetical protein BGW99_109106 [Fibrobacter sp. UWB6]SHG41881.1 hypothetical protein SAMN05720760_110106 [Fibrobacter sp. UWB8]SMG38386.1 hypothetical protein SAMN05720473_109106 [Fibrobacter sp. UWB15]
MFDLNAFFEGMSKPLLRNAHAKAFGHKGLLNNALIQDETLGYYNDNVRVAGLFQKMEPWQRHCMVLIYNSASRGLTFNELRLTVPVSKCRDLQNFLLEMCREYVLWRSPSASTSVYYGFANFIDIFSMPLEDAPAVKGADIFYQNLIDWHICEVLALGMTGELKVNNSNLLHRRSYQICTDAFTSAKRISEKTAENELSLIFNFLTVNGWLEQEDACLVPTETALEFIRKNGFRLHQDLVSWWLKERFRGDRSHCVRLLKMLDKPRTAPVASSIFWVMDPTFRLQEKDGLIAWEYLPRPLRELWLLGLVRFTMVNGKIAAVTLEQAGRDWIESSIASIPEQNISCLPNFELIASTGTSPRVLLMLACLTKVENDEVYLRFSLNRDSYIRGLKCGIAESEVENFKGWIKPPVNVESTIAEWNSSYYGARVQTVRLLKIENADVLNELSRFPQFMECTNEYIAGYGFVLKPEMESRAFDILTNYGYCPFVERKNTNRSSAPTEEWRKDFAAGWPEAKAPDYELKDTANSETLQTALNSTKYGNNYQKLSTFDLVKVLRYAKTVGALIGAKVKNPTKRGESEVERNFFVHALKLAKSPQTIEIQPYGSEVPELLELSFIQEVKVYNGHQP